MTNILIVGEVALYREGLKDALCHREEVFHVVTACCSMEALDYVATAEPDAILLDLAMQDSLRMVRSLAQGTESAVIIVLAVPDSEDDIIACAEAGATAYITREGSIDELVATIQAANAGRLNCSAKIAGTLFRRLFTASSGRQPAAGCERLSPREMQILCLIEKGQSNKEISRSLGIELATVKNHVHNILEKMNVSRRGEAAAILRNTA